MSYERIGDKVQAVDIVDRGGMLDDCPTKNDEWSELRDIAISYRRERGPERNTETWGTRYHPLISRLCFTCRGDPCGRPPVGSAARS